MLTVDQYELIRRKLFVDGKSIRQTAKELGHSRKTVIKTIGQAIPPVYTRKAPYARPVIDLVKQ